MDIYIAIDYALCKRSGRVINGQWIMAIIRETTKVTDCYPVAVDVIIGPLERKVPFVLLLNTF